MLSLTSDYVSTVVCAQRPSHPSILHKKSALLIAPLPHGLLLTHSCVFACRICSWGGSRFWTYWHLRRHGVCSLGEGGGEQPQLDKCTEEM